MALQIKQTEKFFWPVKVAMPRDGGGFETQTFDAEFKRLPRTESEALGQQVVNGEISGVDAVRQVWVGWRGVVAGTDDVPYSESNREAVLEIQGVALAVFKAYQEANSGAAQLKN